MQGIDASFEMDFTAKYNEAVLFRRFTAGYTFIDAQVSDQVAFSKYTLNHLRHQVVASVEHRIFRGIVHSARMRWCDRPTNTSTVKGDYWVADSRISWKYRNWKVYAEATNVFNTVYGEIRYSDTTVLTMPGRWFRAGFTVQIL
jgi:iron complex outermembrane receptor protein